MVIVSEGLHRQEVFFIKRWRYLCAAALIAGSMAAGAGAVSIPSTALTQLQQQRQAAQESWESVSIEEHMEHYLSQNYSEKDAMKQVAKDRGVSKREIYSYLHKD